MIAVFPNLLVIGAYILGWIPESLSWLLVKNKIQKAREILVSVAKVNGKDIKVSAERTIKISSTPNMNYKDQRILPTSGGP